MTTAGRARYIAVDGPIGAGKTSLTRLLAEALAAEGVFEGVAENPFLERFYDDPPRHALATQLSFLLGRHRQQQRIGALLADGHTVVCDYSPAKEDIFAALNLAGDELALYREVRSALPAVGRVPDLVVYLQAEVRVLLERVRRRGDQRERRITPDYLHRVAEAYRQRFFDYDAGPLLVVDCSAIDFVQRDADMDELVREILRMDRGTRHYIPRRR